MPMPIRPLRPADRPEWLRLRRALWPNYPLEQIESESTPFFQTGQIWTLPAAVFVAERTATTLAGFIEVSLRPLAAGCISSPVGYLEGWYVDPDARRQGTGRALVAAAESWARAQGCAEIASDCDTPNRISFDAHTALDYRAADKNILFHKPLASSPITPTTDFIGLVPYDLPIAAAIQAITHPAAGGIDVFLGTTRAECNAANQPLLALHYEAYPEMATQQLHALAARARQQWPILKLALLHRTGPVPIGEPSVLIAVSTPHRAESFQACQFLIDTLKSEVAIWKQEIWQDAPPTWVHPSNPEDRGSKAEDRKG